MWIYCVAIFGLIQGLSIVYGHGGEQHRDLDIPESLRFIQEPEDTYVLSLVEEVQLDCQASSPFGNITYTWLKKENDGSIKVVKKSTTTLFNDGHLIFRSPSLFNENSGIYQCQVQNSEGLILSREAKLSYAVVYPSLLTAPAPIQVMEHSGVVVSCPLRDFSLPDVDYKWMKDSETLSPNSPSRFIALDGRLYFSEARKSDAGVYKCETSFRTITGNGIYVGNASDNAHTSLGTRLIVMEQALQSEPFHIVEGFPNVFPVQPKLGQTVEIECIAFGQLPFSYSWRFNGNLITNRSRMSDENRRLIIENIQITDEGTYTCIVVNADGNETFMFRTIEVAGRPIFSMELSDDVAKSNGFLKLNCFVYAPSEPVVTWLKDGVPIKNITDTYHADSRSLILFKPAVDRDGGMYQCAARNIYGTVYSTAKITVEDVPLSENNTPQTIPVIVLLISLVILPFV